MRYHFASLYLVLSLGLRWLEWAGQDCNLGILYPLWHLGMAHVLVNDYAIDKLGILQPASHLSVDLCSQGQC